MDSQPSRISIDDSPNRLKVVGVVDSHTASQLRDAIIAHGHTDDDLVLDLADVEFIDSSGLRIIVNAHSELEAASRRLVLTNTSSAVTRLLEITGLHEHLHVH
ncbi:MAG: STAS domain-containing protein [Acidimicrobiales bacterium]